MSAPCGTERGYKSHTIRREVACAACLSAHAAYARERRRATGEVRRDLKRCRHCGSVFPGHDCHMEARP